MQFQGHYRYLSNFWPCRILMDGDAYPSVEHAYQAAKTLVPGERERVLQCKTPGLAKREGRKLSIRTDWNNVKLKIMYELVLHKFAAHPKLREKLQDDFNGFSEIVEDNTWHDNYWGNCLCLSCNQKKGLNHLGLILMQVRDLLPGEEVR